MNHTKIYAVKHKNKDIRKASSSGGLFTALSDVFLENGDAIASSVYNYATNQMEFRIYDNIEDRNSARGSKYIQTIIGNGFCNIEEWLFSHPGKKLLVVGTGCQMAGLINFLEYKKLRNRVTVVDLICHGVTSTYFWKKYLDYLGLEGEVKVVSFKDKRIGWKEPVAFVKTQNKEHLLPGYCNWFYGRWSIRESCYKCPFTKIERDTDITIGDYWGIENVDSAFADSLGVSLAIVHTEMGRHLMEWIKDIVDIIETDSDACLQPRLISPARRPWNRKHFWKDIRKRGFAYCEKKYHESDQNSLLLMLQNRFQKLKGK